MLDSVGAPPSPPKIKIRNVTFVRLHLFDLVGNGGHHRAWKSARHHVFSEKDTAISRFPYLNPGPNLYTQREGGKCALKTGWVILLSGRAFFILKAGSQGFPPRTPPVAHAISTGAPGEIDGYSAT